MSTPDICQMLDITTAVLKPETLELLLQEGLNGPSYLPEHHPRLISHDYGWLVNVSEDIREVALAQQCPTEGLQMVSALYPGVPEDLLRVLLWAGQHGCRWVMFDQDGGDVPEGLPEFDHG